MAYNYWEERFKRLKTAEMQKAERANADLARVYRETLRQLRAEVEQWYDRFAKENKISLAEARRILDNRELKEFKMTLTDFIKEAKRLDLDPAHIRMLENASMRVRLTRSQEIYFKTAQYVEKLAKTQGLELSGLMRDVYTDSAYKTAYETQKVTGFENFRAVRERQIEEAISKPWAPDGADFSSRIWKNKTQLINSLQTDITQSLMTGTSTAQLSEKIAARFNTSYNQAYRLVETETAYIQEKAMLDTYDELGLEQYQICAVLDSKTSEICQDLDGKVFDRKDAKPGITMPPFHCHCRSTTVPYIEGLLDDGGRVARDPETGKTVEIPDMTYKEWKAEYVKPVKQTKDEGNDIIKAKKEVIAGVTRGKPMTFEQANTGRANPRYAPGLRGERQYQINCQTCVVAHELRMRGYDVQAIGNTEGSMCNKVAKDPVLPWIDKETGKKPVALKSSDNNVRTAPQLEKWIKETVEPNARYHFYFSWRGLNNCGHIVTLNTDSLGNATLYDPQVSELISLSKLRSYLKNIKLEMSVYGIKITLPTYLYRVDNLDINFDIVEQMMMKAERGRDD